MTSCPSAANVADYAMRSPGFLGVWHNARIYSSVTHRNESDKRRAGPMKTAMNFVPALGVVLALAVRLTLAQAEYGASRADR